MVHITDLTLKNFTCFSELELSFSPGVNIFIGANGTGKTHILKVLYSSCATTTTGDKSLYSIKLLRVFSPLFDNLKLFHRSSATKKQSRIKIKDSQGNRYTSMPSTFFNFDLRPKHRQEQAPIASVYIPVKEFLSHAQGFLSLVKTRRMAFDDTYTDLLTQAFLPPLKDTPFKELQDELLDTLKGDVTIKGENFYLKSGDSEFEFSLVAEGLRKIALLLVLVRNGSIAPGSVLFWDEPETNLNPILLNLIVKSLLTFQRAGIQIFLSTHNYVLLKEFDLQSSEEDKVRYFSLYFDDNADGVRASVSDTYIGIENSEIANTYDDLFRREMERKFKGFAK